MRSIRQGEFNATVCADAKSSFLITRWVSDTAGIVRAYAGARGQLVHPVEWKLHGFCLAFGISASGPQSDQECGHASVDARVFAPAFVLR